MSKIFVRFCIQHKGNRAIRDGKWKIVSKGRISKWELYDMEMDRTEMHDLTRKNKDVATYMMYQWEQWAHERGVVPFGSWKLNPWANLFRKSVTC